MKKSFLKPIFSAIAILFFLNSCKSPNEEPKSVQEETVGQQEQITDGLPSWNDTKNKQAIIDYVNAVTQEGGTEFIPIKDRVAVFDNDGTLWSEQPSYFQLLFAIDQVKKMAKDHPEWKGKQPYQAVIDGDMTSLSKQGMKAIVTLIMTTHAGMSTDDFEEEVVNWMATAKHPKTEQPYNQMIFQPMLELLEFLRANSFKTYIVSGGGIDFMRAWAVDAYGIPEDQIVGSVIKTQFEMTDEGPRLVRLPELDFIDDKEGKPVGIQHFIGKKPVFAAGNSDGDLQMLQWTASSDYKNFELYIHHTDSVREWSYDRGSHIGGFDKGWDEAVDKGWTIVDMAKDWAVIYPFEK